MNMRNGFLDALVIRMRFWSQCLALALLGAACAVAPAQEGKSYKWVDDWTAMVPHLWA
jgi:hypothetical protein